MKHLHVFSVLCLIGLSACGYESHYKDPTDNYVLPAINSSVDQIIANEGQQAVAAQRTLAMIQRAQNPAVRAVDPNANAPAELLAKVTVANYTGPVGGFIKALAQQAGYRYIEPQTPITEQPSVSLNIENRTIAEALDDASLQVQNIMEIVVNPAAHTMTLQKYVPLRGAMVDNPVTNASEPQPSTYHSPRRKTMTFGSGRSSHRVRHIWKTESSHS